ncbi:MAG: HEAT repeat domain-containing protein, partial [Pseudomonadota bacterium]
ADRWIEKVMLAEDASAPDAKKAFEKLVNLGAPAIPKLIDQLEIANKDQMLVLVDLLTRLLNNKTIELYFDGLKQQNRRVTSGVVWALTSQQNYDPNRLLDLLDDPDVPKASLIDVLTYHKRKLKLNGLLQKAYTLDHKEKAEVLRIVEEIADENVLPQLLSRVTGKDSIVRAQIIRIVGKFDRPEVINALQQLLADPDKLVREAALESLANMKGDLNIKSVCALLLDGDLGIQNKAVDVIIRMNHPDTARHLIDALKDESEYARRSAVEVLNEIGTASSIKELLSAVQDEDWWVRARAADALAKIGGPKVVQAVIELIKDEDESIRRAAVEILNSTKDPESMETLVTALNDNDWWVRERAVDALADIGNTQAVPALLKMLKTNNESKPVVLRALAKLGDSQIMEPVLAELDTAEKTVQIEAIKTLAKITDKKRADAVKQRIANATKSGDEAIKEAAVEALSEIDDRLGKVDIVKEVKSETARTLKDAALGAQTDSHTLLVEGDALQEALAQAKPVKQLDINKIKPGDIIEDRYKYVKRIGKGAFGTVLLIEDLAVDEEIILKFLNAPIASDEEMMKRFVYELRYSRKITHQNVIRIYDFLHLGGLYAISMEFFPSHTLGAEIVDNKPMDLRKALGFARDIANGMSAAHRVGIVHRDLKPPNILINEEGVLKVVDFGVAAAHSSGDTQLTKTGYVIGSPKYMAPEQILGKKVAETTDIYSLAVIMYEMLTGNPPYTKGDHMSVMYQHVQGGCPDVHSHNPDVPKEISDVVAKSMSLKPEQRHQSMQELSDIITALLAA